MKSKIKKLHKLWKTPTKWVMFGLVMGVVLATVGSVGALNGWFGGGGFIPEDTLTRGLVGYWGMDEGNGAIAYDNSDYDNDGTLTSGPTWAKGKVGGGLSFDGVNDYVSFANESNFDFDKDNAFSIFAWIKTTRDTQDGIGKHAGGPTYAGYSMAISSGKVRIYLTSEDIPYEGINVQGNTNVNDGNWHYIGFTYNGSYTIADVKIYTDAVSNTVTYGGSNLTGGSWLNNNPVKIGPSMFVGTYYSGLVDEVRIYNRALSAEEVRYHYNRGGPVAHWKFDEGEGRTAYDTTDNNNDGTLVLVGSATSSAWVSGKYGSALSFDGVDDYVDAGNVSANARTISFWLKRGDTSNKDVIDLGTPEIKVASNAITSTGLTSPTYYVDAVQGNTTVAANEWHYVTITATANITANNVDIGKASSNYFLGLIDDVRIYNYARTPEEIRLDYNAGFAAHFGPKSDCKRDPGACMTQGLVGYWGMDEGNGAIAYDNSDYDNDGTLTSGPAWTKGKVAGALSFDGSNDYVDAGNAASLDFDGRTQIFTIEAWIKGNSFPAGSTMIVRKPSQYNIQVTTGNLFRMADDVGSGLTGNTVLSTGVWYHVVGVRNGVTDRIQLYVNGVLDKDAPPATSWTSGTTANPVGIAMSTPVGGNYFNGTIDEVRIYNRALSAEEVRFHYNRGGPVAHWKFDEGEGRTAYDTTDNNNDGTLVLVGSATSSAWVSGKSGTAISFDGVDDYVDIGNTSQSSVKTISFWLKADDITSRKVIDIDGTDQVEIDSSSQITATSFPGTITYYLNGIAGSRTLTADTWYHVAITDTSGVNASNMDIGRVSTGYFSGLIDDVRIYNYARTPEEIRLDYNAGFAAKFGLVASGCTLNPGSCMTQGLIGYWPIDEGNGTMAYDNSDYDNDGTLTSGPTWAKGKVAGGLSFDGSNDYVDAGDIAGVEGLSEISVETWIKPNQITADGTVASKGPLAPASTWVLWQDDVGSISGRTDTVSFLVSNGTVRTAAEGAIGVVAVGQWVHIVGVWVKSPESIKIYVNGVLSGQNTLLSGVTMSTSANPVRMGADSLGATYNFNGTIDEVRIYNRALSAEEVRYHYNRGGPVAQWKFDEGEGRTAYDTTDNNNDGTLVLVGSATSSAWVAGKYGSALSFDGVDDYVDIGNTSQSTVKTVSFWLKADDITSRKVIDIDGTDQVEIDSSSQITATSFPGTITYYLNGIAGSRTLTADTWYHVAITDTSGVNASNMDIGRVSTGYFSGLIDDVRIYNYARTPEQILQDYNSGLGTHFR